MCLRYSSINLHALRGRSCHPSEPALAGVHLTKGGASSPASCVFPIRGVSPNPMRSVQHVTKCLPRTRGFTDEFRDQPTDKTVSFPHAGVHRTTTIFGLTRSRVGRTTPPTALSSKSSRLHDRLRYWCLPSRTGTLQNLPHLHMPPLATIGRPLS
jgi:hypothetical protein